MAKKRVKVRASTTTSVPSNGGTTNPLQEEVTVPSPTTMIGGGAEVTSEIKNVNQNTSEEGAKEDTPVLVVTNGEVAIQEGGNNGTNNPLQEGMTVPSPTAVKGEGTEVGSVIKNEEKHSNEGIGEETAMVVMKNGEVSMEEGGKETAAIDKEKLEVAVIEGKAVDKGFDEPNSADEKDDDQMEIGGGGDYSEEDDDYEEEDDKDEDEGEEEEEEDEEEEEEEQMEIGEEEAGEEGKKEDENVEETFLVAKTEEKMEEEKKEVGNVEETLLVAKSEKMIEANSGGVGKKLMVRRRLKKVGIKGEDKPTSSKEIVASTAEDKPGASSKMKGTTEEEDKSKVLSKKKAGAKVEDKPEASSKKKPPKRVQSMGLIFMCNSKTKQDCYRYKVLGLPASKKDLVQKVYKGMRLFLFDIDLRLMYGIYKAAGPGGYNIQPKAFDSAFPSQVKFTVVEDCLPLAEEKFKSILKDNYYAKKKFDCQLNSEQVKNLCKLFNASGRISRLKNRKNVVGTETYPVADRARIGRPMAVGERLGRGRNRRKRSDAESLDPRPRVGRERSDRIKRNRLDEESIERDRIRRQILDEERLDRDRIRRQREDEERFDRGRTRRQRLDEESWDPQYHDRPILYERERYASPLPPPPRAYDSSSRAYDSYGRIAETSMYMRERDPVVDRRERVPVLEHRSGLPAVDRLERVPLLEHRSGLPAVDRHVRVPVLEHRSGLPAVDHDRRILDLRRRDEVGIRDPYTSYREYNPPPRVQAVATYLPHASSAPEYRQREEAPAYEYGSLRSLYRY